MKKRNDAVKALSIFWAVFLFDACVKRVLFAHGFAQLNSGYGFFSTVSAWFIFLAGAVALIFFFLAVRESILERPFLGSALIAAGAFSNIADRIQFKGVIDFIPLPFSQPDHRHAIGSYHGGLVY